MVILRPTRKLRSALPVAMVSAQSDAALGDWYVNRFVVDRQPLLLLVSSASLLAILLAARGMRTPPDRLGEVVASRLFRLGIAPEAIACERMAMLPVAVAPTVDRSVLGVMVDFAKTVPCYLEPGNWTERTLVMVEDRLAETPCRVGQGEKQVFSPERRASELLRAKWLAN